MQNLHNNNQIAVFCCVIPMHNIFMQLAILTCTKNITFSFNVCVSAKFINGKKMIYLHPDISKIFFRYMCEKTVHTNKCYQTSNKFGESIE